jgi:hypothetical protein
MCRNIYRSEKLYPPVKKCSSLIMATKWKYFGLNAKLEVILLREIGKWYEFT